jgi:hypothetical protein
MPFAAAVAPQRAPRRARYLIPPGTPRRREVLAALTLLAVLASLLFAQVTLGLTIAFHAVSKISRWPPTWFAGPAACGLIWVLAIGPAAALAGFTAAPRVAVALLARAVTDPLRAFHLSGVTGRTGHWLPGQFPLALILAAGIAAAWWWLDWLHTDEWDVPVSRPGLVAVCRGWLTAAFVRSGGVLARGGVSLGIDRASGRPAAVLWREAEQGVLVTGSAWAAVAASSFQVVHAAIRLRKPVIVVDLAGGPGLAGPLAAVCSAAGAPMQVFGARGTGYYEPMAGGDPARMAALVMSVIDWDQAPDSARVSCQACLTDLFAVRAAAPGDPAGAMLDEVAGLLRPEVLRARMAQVPSYHPGRGLLAERAAVTVSRLEADRAMALSVAEQLVSLRASPLGRWLCPAPGPLPGTRISLADVVRQRGVALFSLDGATHGRPADMIANLVARDTAEVYAGYRRAAVSGDGVCWFSACETVDQAALAELAAAGAATGRACLLATTSPAAAGRLVDQVNVLVLHRLDDPALADRLGWLAGRRLAPAEGVAAELVPAGYVPERIAGERVPAEHVPAERVPARSTRAGRNGGAPEANPPAPPGMYWRPAVGGEALCALGDGEFTLITRGTAGTEGTVVPLALRVPARVRGKATDRGWAG